MDQDKTIIDENDEIVSLTYDDGTQEDFYTIAELDYEGKWYIYLVPVEPDDDFDEDEVIIYEVAEDEDGAEIFLPIEDDELLDTLAELLNEEIDKLED